MTFRQGVRRRDRSVVKFHEIFGSYRRGFSIVSGWVSQFICEKRAADGFGVGHTGLPGLLRLDKEVRRKWELPSFETRYFMSSLDPDEVSASPFQGLILGHCEAIWKITSWK